MNKQKEGEPVMALLPQPVAKVHRMVDFLAKKWYNKRGDKRC